MSWQEEMYKDLARVMRDKWNIDAVKVTGFQDEKKSMGYCETCYYEYMACDITYEDSNGDTQVYEAWTTFAELINDLTNE